MSVLRILILSNTPWNNSNSFGNSFSNIFSGIDNIEIANIYCRYGEPDNCIVKKYFQITEKSLIKNLKNSSSPSGKEVFIEADSTDLNEKEQIAFDSARKKRWQIMFWARDFVWKIGRWCSPELKAFIDDFKPDVIFQPIYYSNYISDIALFIKKYTGVPMVGYISDDCYTLRQFNLSPLYWIDRLHKRKKVKQVFMSCEFVYVISEIQKREYEKIFGKECRILTKCADFSEEPLLKAEPSKPIQMVYTGNLGSGRWKSVSYISEALKRINENSKKVEMHIYSATPLSAKQMSKISDGVNSFFEGRVPSSEIEKIQKSADILVHVEGLSLKSRLAVHQSFSTKIVDYLKNARAVFVVGPSDAASVDYFLRHDSAVVATDKNDVENKLRKYTDTPENIKEYAKKAYLCGRKNHSAEKIKKMVYNDLKRVTDGI